METDECLRILLDRCPGLRPAYRTPDWLPTAPIGHRLASLPVTFGQPETEGRTSS
jgi:hypothetical protein